MFRIVCDPSSGSTELCLTEITLSGSQIFFVCLVVVPCTPTAGSKLRCQTPTKHTTNICEPLRIISVKYSSILPDDGSRTIRNNVGVIFNSVSFKILWNVDFNL